MNWSIPLFSGYLFLFLWFAGKAGFFRRSGLSATELRSLFLVKVLAGIAYGYAGLHYYQQGQLLDTWWLHHAGREEWHLLQEHPGQLFSGWLSKDYPRGYGGFLSSRGSWWNDLHTNVFIKVMALMQGLSGGRYFVIVLFFAAASMTASVALYRWFRSIYPNRKWPLLAGAFLIPSHLFWTTGIYRDAPVALGLALVLYAFGCWIGGRARAGHAAAFLLGLLLILVFRNYLVLLVFPGLLAWRLSVNRNTAACFTAVYGLTVLLFFGARLLWPALDFPQAVVEKQEDFLRLSGRSFVPMPLLSRSVGSFLAAAPEALLRMLFRPLPGDAYNLFLRLSCAELLLLWAVALAALTRLRSFRLSPPLAFCLFFSVSLLLLTGYIVPFLGAMVRYRALLLPLLLTPLICMAFSSKRPYTY